MTRIRAIILLVLAIGLLAFMLFRGHRDLTLLYDRVEVEGRIIDVVQPPPWQFRAADYEVWYEFEDEHGTIHRGHDVLPPKRPPTDDALVQVAYSRRNPGVSRIASQRSLTPLRGVILSLSMLTIALASLFSSRRRGTASVEQNPHGRNR